MMVVAVVGWRKVKREIKSSVIIAIVMMSFLGGEFGRWLNGFFLL